MIVQLLAEIGVSEEEAHIYSLLLETGPMQAGKLAMRVGVPRSSLYGTLGKLHECGLVSQSVRDGVKVFAAQDPAVVLKLFQQRIDKLTAAQLDYKRILPTLLSRNSSSLIAPKFQIYEGGDGLKSVLQDMLLYSNIDTAALWPIESMVDILTPQFFRYLNRERIRSKIHTRAIWPADQVLNMVEHPYLGSGPAFYREIRIAPETMKFSMGYWIYADKAAFLASRRESFGFIIQSRELVELLLAQFDVLWQLSAPLGTSTAATDKASKQFLDEV